MLEVLRPAKDACEAEIFSLPSKLFRVFGFLSLDYY